MFQNHHVAFDWFIKLHSGNIDHFDYKNTGHDGDRHLALWLKDKRRYYCLFKREMTHSFNYLAKGLVEKYPDLAGHGESINVEWFTWAKNNHFQIVYIYQNGKVYEINPKTIEAVSIVYEQKRVNKYIRDGVFIEQQEKVRMFPVKLMIPMCI